LTTVVDASVALAAAVDEAASGDWARQLLGKGENLVAPHLLPVEAANLLRKLVQRGRLSDRLAALELAQITRLRIAYYPFVPLAARVWDLRNNVSAYDGWYVALAEALKAPLATLDARLVRATGPRCQFLTFP
jgi:predicted nucleic acid-binding protein